MTTTSRQQILDSLGPADMAPLAGAVSTASGSRVIGSCVERFVELATAAKTTVEQVADVADVPAAVAAYLGDAAPAAGIVRGDLPYLTPTAWSVAGLSCDRTVVEPDNDVYVDSAYAAIAECGALVINTRAGFALGNAFLCATQILVLDASRIVATLEDCWQLVRQECDEALPREFCFVNGPSRTGDLGLPVKLGAHGPARVHVVLVGD